MIIFFYAINIVSHKFWNKNCQNKNCQNEILQKRSKKNFIEQIKDLSKIFTSLPKKIVLNICY